MGIYAPITKPDAAEMIPKKAPELCVDLKKTMNVMKNAVAETAPINTIPYALKTSAAERGIPPLNPSIASPRVSISPVIIHAQQDADTKYERMICHLFIGVAEIS